MAGYLKIWTFIRHELWFKSLKASQRGALLEMLLMVKEQQDNGHLVVNSMSVLALELSINRKTLSKLVVKLTQGCAPPLVIFNQHPLDLYFSKYLKWQQMTVTEAVKHAQAPGVKVTSYHTIPDYTIPEEETPVFSKPPKEEWLQNLSPMQRDFVNWETGEFEMTVLPRMASFYGGLPQLRDFPGWRGGVPFVRDYEQELRAKVMSNPDYFKDHKPWKDELTRFIKIGISAGRVGSGGLKGMSAVDERTHEAGKRVKT